MPIYEYQCNACEHLFEKRQSISDTSVVTCPVCSQSEAKRLISAAGFQLKGSGWYETDYKKKAKPASNSDSKAKPDKKTTETSTKKESSSE